MDIKSSNNARKFIDYLEAFSCANLLADDMKSYSISMEYTAIFRRYSLSIDADFSDGKMKIKVGSAPLAMIYIKVDEFESLFLYIKKLVNGVCSYDGLRGVMSFIVYDFENLNLLISLLAESFL